MLRNQNSEIRIREMSVEHGKAKVVGQMERKGQRRRSNQSRERSPENREEGVQSEEPDPPASTEMSPVPAGVRFSEGEKEMVDIGAALKQGRGRPWK